MPRSKHAVVPISEEEFWNTYKPISHEEGNFEISHEEAREFPRDSVWSIVRGEIDPNKLYALPGFRVGDVLGYIVTERFWESELIEAVYRNPIGE